MMAVRGDCQPNMDLTALQEVCFWTVHVECDNVDLTRASPVATIVVAPSLVEVSSAKRSYLGRVRPLPEQWLVIVMIMPIDRFFGL